MITHIFFLSFILIIMKKTLLMIHQLKAVDQQKSHIIASLNIILDSRLYKFVRMPHSRPTLSEFLGISRSGSRESYECLHLRDFVLLLAAFL